MTLWEALCVGLLTRIGLRFINIPKSFCYLLCQDPALVLPVVTLQTPGTLGLRGGHWGLLTHDDGLLTRELLKAPQVSRVLSEAGGVRQPGPIDVLTVSIGIQATVTLTTILDKSIQVLDKF